MQDDSIQQTDQANGKKISDSSIEETIDGEVGIEENDVAVHQLCEKEINELKEQLEEIQGKYKRTLADYQNLERQTTEQQKRFVKLATEGFVQDLVVPFAHLQLAARHLKDKGLDMVVAQFKSVCESQGLKEIDVLGKPFDASRMEAIEVKEGENNIVLEVSEAGYELNGVLVKPARVVVGKTG